MSSTRPRVHIVEGDPGLGELEALILQEEGYDAVWELLSSETIEHIRRQPPALILLETAPTRDGDSSAFRFLDDLRALPLTAGIPVVVMTTIQDIAEQAHASYNVRAVLQKPFDIVDLTGKVRVALDHPPLQAAIPPDVEPGGLLQVAERVLSRRSRDVMLAWVQRLKMEDPWRSRDDLRLSALFDTVPVLLETVVAALRYGGGNRYLAAHPEAFRRVRGHAAERRMQGIPLHAAVREYTLLRHEVLLLLERSLPENASTREVFALQYAVNDALDRVIEATIPAYLEPPPDPTSYS